MIDITGRFSIPGRGFGDNRAHGLEETDIVTDPDRLVVRYGERECLRQLRDSLK
jgi:hypothetical protein